MGGYGSGRQGGRPLAEHSMRIDLNWMLRTGRVRPGGFVSGTLSWSWGDEHAGTIGYTAIMDEPGAERLELAYSRGPAGEREDVRQTIRLTHTPQHYGGKRWWMICPYRSIRVGKLYKPSGGDRFASRNAWRLGYKSQRLAHRDRAGEALFRLQRKLGSREGWDGGLARPKGMWHRTYDRHFERYLALNHQVTMDVLDMVNRLR